MTSGRKLCIGLFTVVVGLAFHSCLGHGQTDADARRVEASPSGTADDSGAPGGDDRPSRAAQGRPAEDSGRSGRAGGTSHAPEGNLEEFDYRRLREQLHRERTDPRVRSSKILGLPGEKFYSPAKASSLRAVFQSALWNEGVIVFLDSVQPAQGGAIWLWSAVLLCVAFNGRRLLSWRNLDLLLLVAMCFLFVDLLPLGSRGLDKPQVRSIARLFFTGIFVFGLYWLVRSLIGAFLRPGQPWVPNLPTRLMAVLAGLGFALSALICFVNLPVDCGHYINIGAKRMRQTGMFPYGDPMLRGGAAATYGPILYVSHIPLQLVFPDSDRPVAGLSPKDGNGEEFTRPSRSATRVCLLLYHLMGIAALVVIGRQLGGSSIGWALACLYSCSAYVLGLGGAVEAICGVTYISHIAPAAMTLVAFALLSRPVLSGMALGLSAGVLFYPVFLAPLWFGYYFWRRWGVRQFLLGFVGTAVLIAGAVILRTEGTETESAAKVFVMSTVAHQEHPDVYGSSSFGFWGVHPKLRAFWHRPLVDGWFILKPAFVGYLVLVIASFFLARGRNRSQLAFLIAALAVGVQLWKSHATGTYVEWYLPFLLIGLLTSDVGCSAVGPPHHTTDDENATK